MCIYVNIYLCIYIYSIYVCIHMHACIYDDGVIVKWCISPMRLTVRHTCLGCSVKSNENQLSKHKVTERSATADYIFTM